MGCCVSRDVPTQRPTKQSTIAVAAERSQILKYLLEPYSMESYAPLEEKQLGKYSTPVQKDINCELPSELLPRLYLGSKQNAMDSEILKKYRITHILSVMGEIEHKFDDCELLNVSMASEGTTVLADIAQRCFPFMNKATRPGCKLLVHCTRGVNRSSTLVIAWLMETFHCAFYNAWKAVKESREIIQPTPRYVEQLRAIDLETQGVHSTPDNFLGETLTDGVLGTAHENMTLKESNEYRESQRIRMTPEEKTLYSERRKRLAQQLSLERSVVYSHFAHSDVKQASPPDFVIERSCVSSKSIIESPKTSVESPKMSIK